MHTCILQSKAVGSYIAVNYMYMLLANKYKMYIPSGSDWGVHVKIAKGFCLLGDTDKDGRWQLLFEQYQLFPNQADT